MLPCRRLLLTESTQFCDSAFRKLKTFLEPEDLVTDVLEDRGLAGLREKLTGAPAPTRGR